MSTATQERVCDTHGSYGSHRYGGDQWTGCPTCAHQVMEQRRQQEYAEERRQRLEHNRRAYLSDSGICGRYLEPGLFDAYEVTTKPQRDVLAGCKAYADAFHPDQGAGLFLLGPPGTGKTHLGCAIATDVIRRLVVPAKVASARQIIRRLRSTWRKGSDESEQDVINEFGTAALLVLDEVGAGFGSDGELVQLFDVLDLRYQLKAPTVVLSNLNAPLLRAALGDRIYDRLREGAKALVLDWASYRRRGGAA